MTKELIEQIKQLKDEEALIDKYVKLFYPKNSKYKKPITDGVTDVEKYLSSKYKICWVLKEPYDEEDGYGGGFDLRKMLTKDLKKENHYFGKTWTHIGFVSYSILHDFISLEKIKEMDRKEYMQSLLHISYINTSKMPSKTGTYMKPKALWEGYKLWRPILYWQLLKYNPDIIIYGYTMNCFWDDLELDKGKENDNENGYFVIKDGKIHIWAYAPSQRTITDEKYFNGIINSVKKGLKKTGKLK
jgi:hypothetical protein